MLITSRPLDEYCQLFGLSRAALRATPGPVLDCPGGAAGLVAEARQLGCRVVATDPVYALPLSTRLARAEAARRRMAIAMPASPGRYLAPRYRPYDKYLRSWDRARALFAADTLAHPDGYVAAALPRLPFADDTFALTLSSYLLFAYPALFSPQAQLTALLELARVTAPGGEVLVHPVHDSHSVRCPHLDELRFALGSHRVSSELRTLRRPGDGRRRYVLALSRLPRYGAVPWTNP
ncbi:class I SAM-dependent methyltransferase [Kitasatospora mediocidica]|uniref:class I SAM-dependent methyltransferase n=1 Tax=Kitasatospora mediocidica TaxID=58352 RepID=UPI00068D81E6|nr:class I SAM-dependent methyltransferase [Kitasatospora mediocidica]